MLLEVEKKTQQKYEEALNRDEIFWEEKARLNRHLEGDKNPKYFRRW